LLRDLGDRLWIPHQVAAEYQRRRATVINEQIGYIQDLCNKVKATGELIRSALPEQHPFSGVDRDQEEAYAVCQRVRKSLGRKRGHYQRLLQDDKVREELDEMLAGRVGLAYEPEKLEKVIQQGEKRYGIRFPPGFADDRKRGVSAFGDWIIWS